MMKLLIHQMGLREAAVVPLGGPQAASQTVPGQSASSGSVTASVEAELGEDVQIFIHKMASSFEKSLLRSMFGHSEF